jgi:two-component system chemotaxis sensor kinase CheA
VGPRSVPAEDTIRVAALAVDRALDRVAGATRATEVISATTRERERAALVRTLRSELRVALRLIGPPRPWGAPAAAVRRVDTVATSLGTLAESLDLSANTHRSGEQSLREDLGAIQRELFAMREARLKSLFARMAAAIESEARRSGREIVVRTSGAEEACDRRVVEQLTEPCLQLARNAVAHGIETPAARTAMGKPSAGTIAITARKHGTRLRLTIDDDGAGVDVAALRAVAVERGAVPAEVADTADDDTLLGLLFLPGFSLRATTDVLAGRGIGLDIVLASVQRMAGVIHVSSTRGRGFRVEVEVPIESGLAKVVWVRAGNASYGLLASHVRRVHASGEGACATLAACLDPGPSTNAGVEPAPDGLTRLAIDLDVSGPEVRLGVDAVGEPTDELVRPPTPIIAALGPFVGVVAREDATPALVLDAYTVASRARALASTRA